MSVWKLLEEAIASRIGTKPFSKDDAVIAAWEMYPKVFGLKSRPDLPDSHAVYARFFGSSGLIAKKIIRQVDQGRYQLVRNAMEKAKRREKKVTVPREKEPKEVKPEPETQHKIAPPLSSSSTVRTNVPWSKP